MARVEINMQQILNRINQANDEGRRIVTEEFVKDANYYVRQDTGDLKTSAIRHSDFENGKAVWNTEYARKVYYTGRPVLDRNPNASLMWAHKAHMQHKDKYLRILKAIARRLSNV